jgi:hypothetical protein
LQLSEYVEIMVSCPVCWGKEMAQRLNSALSKLGLGKSLSRLR